MVIKQRTDCCRLSEITEDGKFYESLLGHETFDGIQNPRHFYYTEKLDFR